MISILIVEDDMTLRGVLYDLFSEDFPCYAVKSAEEAMKRLETAPCSIVLTDISMPGMSGLELLSMIKQKWQDVPVILFSGIDDKEYASGLLKMGAFDYLSKPFALEQIVQSVTRAIMEHPQLKNDPLVNEDVEASVPARAEHKTGDNSPLFASVQLGGIISLAELLDIVQRGKMNGYIELHWDNTTLMRARESNKFNDATGALDEAVMNCAGWIYLKEGHIIDAVIDETEGSSFWRDAEESLAVLVKLATYIGKGVCAWGFSTDDVVREERLSVRDNSAKLFDIITSHESEEEDSHIVCAADKPVLSHAAAGVM